MRAHIAGSTLAGILQDQILLRHRARARLILIES